MEYVWISSLWIGIFQRATQGARMLYTERGQLWCQLLLVNLHVWPFWATVFSSVIVKSTIVLIIILLRDDWGLDEVLLDLPSFAACKFENCRSCGGGSLNLLTSNIWKREILEATLHHVAISLANANNSASFKRKMVWKWRFLLIHKQQTNLWMKLPTIPPGLAGKIVKYRLLSEPITLQGLEDSARSQAWKKIIRHILP